MFVLARKSMQQSACCGDTCGTRTIRRYMYALIESLVLAWNPVHYNFFVIIQMWWKFHFALIQIHMNQLLQICTRYDNCTVVACVNICSDMMSWNVIIIKQKNRRISIMIEKLLVK